MSLPGKKEKLKLGALLLENDLITQGQLDEALKSQVIFGGKLGTNLVELGFLDEEALAYFLSEKLSVPYAHPKSLLDLDKAILKIIPQNIAEKYHVLPISVKKKRLQLVMEDPQNYDAINEISFLTGYQVEPMVTPELRLNQALEVHYGIPREVRYIAFRDNVKERQEIEEIEQRRNAKFTGSPDYSTTHEPKIIERPEIKPPASLKPVVQIGEPEQSEKEKESDEVSQEQILAKVKELKEKRKNMLAHRQAAGIGVMTPPPAPAHLARMYDELTRVQDKTGLGQALVNYLTSKHPLGVILAVKGDTAYGWCSTGDTSCSENTSKLRVPMTVPSVLKRAIESGVAVQEGHDVTPMDRMIRKIVKVEDSLVMAAVPVSFHQVTVCFIIAFGAREAMNQAELDELKTVAGEAEKTFARLIQPLQKDAT